MSGPALSRVVFDEWTGLLTLIGDGLTTNANDFSISGLTLTGQGGASYTLTGASTILGTPTSGLLTIQLSSADLAEVASLFTKAGGSALDGTVYAIHASAGWDGAGSSAQSAAAANLNGFSFDAATGRFVGDANSATALANLIAAANAASSGAYEIDVSGKVALSSAQTPIHLKAGVTLAFADAFTELGPSPKIGSIDLTQSADQPPNGTVAGAVQAIVADPTDPNTIWIGAPDGGVWVTHDGGATWTPLTDHQASLSIASLSLDPTDPTNQTLIAGVGLTSNGTLGSYANSASFFLGDGGQRTGLLYSRDGGATWTALGGSTLAGHSIVGVQARGDTILAAAFEPWALYAGDATEASSGGLFRSTDGGATFAQVAGLPADPTSSLIGDPTNANRLYAAITSPTDALATALYVSNDLGATWTQAFGAAQSGGAIGGGETFIRAAANGSEIAVAVADVGTNALTGLFLSSDAGASWTALPIAGLDLGGQAEINLAVALDPNQAGVVYVTGAGVSSPPYTVAAYRVTASGAQALTGADGSTVHADSRSMAFDANGRLILGTDGGIYARSDPTSASGVWTGLNGANLSLGQPYAVAFDGSTDRLVVAAQDIGVSVETQPGGQSFTAIAGGDGVNAVVNDQTGDDLSVIYYGSQSLEMSRIVVDASGAQLEYSFITFDNQDIYFVPTFQSPFVLNNVDPTRIAIGAGNVYTTQDNLAGLSSQGAVTLTLSDVGSLGGDDYTLAYGTQDNVNALLAGSFGNDDLWLSTGGSFNPLASYAGLTPTGLAFDVRTQNRFYVADSVNLYGTTDMGASMQTLTSNLTPLDIIRPMSVLFVSNNGVDELLVGGLESVANAQSPIAVADSDIDGNLSHWRAFGAGLPNTLVGAMSYDAKADTLSVGEYGRGGWALYDVTSHFATAATLQFGLANNNSTPDVALLTGSRALEKYGTGTLTVTGAASYSGGSTIDAGLLQLNAGASLVGTIAFNGLSAGLGLASDSGFGNTLSGLEVGAGDVRTNYIDIEGHVVTIASETGQGTQSGSVTLSDGVVLHLANLSSTNWSAQASSDGAGGAYVYLTNAACFVGGTHILTERGEVAIESLRLGDLVVTASGRRRPVRWIGRRSLDLTRHPDPVAVWPVRVATGAFGEAAPHRDLWLSPGHNVVSEGVLMPIAALVNGVSVKQIPRDRVVYFHVELDAHDILFAEGLATESYLDCGNRMAFENGGAFVEAHPDFAPKHGSDTCLPLVADGVEVARTKARLLARLEAGGQRTTRDAAARIVIDGVEVAPMQLSATRLAFVLPQGGREIALVSNVFVPAQQFAESADLRVLGLCVGRLQIDGDDVQLGGNAAPGWREAEFEAGRFMRRWTTGATRLPAGARVVLLDLAGEGRYWAPCEGASVEAVARADG